MKVDNWLTLGTIIDHKVLKNTNMRNSKALLMDWNI